MSVRGPALAAVLLLATGVGGCAGFTPMYAQSGVVPAMRHVSVTVPDNRTGFLMREALDDALARDRQAPPAYRMDINFLERRFPRGLRLDDTANSYELDLDITWTVTDLKTGAVVLQKFTPVTVTYAATNQPYAGIVAQEDSQDRAAQQAAQLIKTDLGIFFSGQQAAQAAPATPPAAR